MSASSQRFEGSFDFKLDPKCRVAVPAAWKPSAGETESLRMLTWKYLDVPVLRVLTDYAYQCMMESIANNPRLAEADRSEIRYSVSAMIEPVSMNDQGKLAVPKKLADKMGFEPSGMVYLRGRITSFDLVSPKHIEEMEALEESKRGRVYGLVSFG